MFSSFYSIAVLVTAAFAQTQEVKDAYPDHAERFDKWGITWEPIKVKTEDGWTLTVFHVTGNQDGPFEVTKNAVIFQHGMGGDAGEFESTATWHEGDPMAFQLAAQGYDVYLPNNRLVTYSNVHDTMTPYEKEFWQIDWTDYGVYDTPAVVRMIQERNGGKKVAYVGHSQGTTQVFAGMGIIPEWYDQNISTAVMLGPCTFPNDWYMYTYNQENWDFMDANDIWAVTTTYGPDWPEKEQIILDSGPQQLQDAVTGGLSALMNVPLKALAAYAQASQMGRFQHYTPDFFDLENPKMPIIDFGLVKEMQVAMFVGMWDNTCPLTIAQKTYEQLGGDKNVSDWIVHPMNGHVPWGFQNSEWFIGHLTGAIDKHADI